jgi:hypothetical protein
MPWEHSSQMDQKTQFVSEFQRAPTTGFSRSAEPSRTWKGRSRSKTNTSPKPCNTAHWIALTGNKAEC